MKDIGKILKERREKKKITLALAHAATKIQVKYLVALEEGNAKIFAAQVYYKSFLKSYAKYLGLDQEILLKRYDESNASHNARQRYDYEHNGEFFVKEIYEEQDEEDEKEESKIGKIETKRIVLALAALAVLTAVFFYLNSKILGPVSKDFNDDKAARIETMRDLKSAASVSSGTVRPLQNYAQNSADLPAIAETSKKVQTKEKSLQNPLPLELQIEAVDNVWVKIEADGKEQFQGTLLKGNSKTFKADKEFSLKIGYTPGIKVFFNGRPIDVISGSVEDVNVINLQREKK